MLQQQDTPAIAFQATLNDETRRWWQCYNCKAYIDTMIVVSGVESFVNPDRVRCPRCKCRNLDTVESGPDGEQYLKDEYMGVPTVKLKAEYIQPIDPRIVDCIMEAKSVISETGLFDLDFKEEPIWPQYLATAIVGCTIRISGILLLIANKLDGRKDRSEGRKNRRKDRQDHKKSSP